MSRCRSRISLVFSIILGFCSLPGCGEADPLNRQAISGEIKLNGGPLAQGTIEFSPSDAQLSPVGTTIEAGRYSIPADRGLSPGDYIVRIGAAGDAPSADELPGDSNVVAKQLIPEDYNVKSQHKVTIVAGQENRFDLNIDAPDSGK